LTPAVTQAQNKETRSAERQIDTVLKEFNESLRGFERELKYFDKVREFRPMLDLRNQLVNQSNEMLRLEQAGPGSGPKIRELVRAMDHESRELSAMSGILRKRADAVSSAKDQEVADRLKAHAEEMVKSIDKLATLFR
jgi:hypothetical protein